MKHPNTILAIGIIAAWGGFCLVASSALIHSVGLGLLGALSSAIGGAAIGRSRVVAAGRTCGNTCPPRAPAESPGDILNVFIFRLSRPEFDS